jgi:hypothetical protein
VLALAVVARFATLGLQSFWFDEAYTPVHVLHSGLGATVRAMVHTENNPPLWYVLVWAWSRVFGTGVVALRSLSALAGVGTVVAAWAIGREIGSRRTAIVLGTIVAVNPLFVWYSQEARPYSLFALLAAVSLLFFLRAWRRPSPRALAGWSLASALALLTHYFAAFLVGPEGLVLLAALVPALRARLAPVGVGGPRLPDVPTRAVLVAVGAVAVCALALLPLIVAQGGHGTQWIGRWPLSSRLVAIPGYYLLGGQSSVLGHGLLLVCAVPALVGLGLLPGLERDEWRRGTMLLALGGLTVAIPLALVAVGADYLAPRNVIAAWLPLSAALALVLTGRRAGVAGTVLAALVCLAGAAVVVAIDLTPRLQRGDWSGVAGALPPAVQQRAIVTVELGAAPLEYYQRGLRPLAPGRSARVSEIDLVGYRPLRPGAARPPTPAFRLVGRRSIHGLLVYRFTAAVPQLLSERLLRAHAITAGRNETLVPAGVRLSLAPGSG